MIQSIAYDLHRVVVETTRPSEARAALEAAGLAVTRADRCSVDVAGCEYHAVHRALEEAGLDPGPYKP